MRRPSLPFSRLLALFCHLTLALQLAACGRDAARANINLGSVAPAFETSRSDAGAVRFPADYFGKPLVICFWADWCKYCEGEMKAIEAVHQRLKDKGLSVLAINAGQDKKTVRSFVGKIGISYPSLLDESSVIVRSYGVVGLPTTFFVDGKGIVRAKIVGEANEATFERHALALLP